MMRGCPDLMKFRRLRRRMKREFGWLEISTIGLLEKLWHLTAKNNPDGAIGLQTDIDLAESFGFIDDDTDDEQEAIKQFQAVFAILVSEKWLDAHPTYRLLVHDWSTWADDAVHMAMARKTQIFADGKMPRLSRFNKVTQKRIEEEYVARYGAQILDHRAGSQPAMEQVEEEADAHAVRTPVEGEAEGTQSPPNSELCAHDAHAVRENAHFQRNEIPEPEKRNSGEKPRTKSQVKGRAAEKREPPGILAHASPGTGPDKSPVPPDLAAKFKAGYEPNAIVDQGNPSAMEERFWWLRWRQLA